MRRPGGRSTWAGAFDNTGGTLKTPPSVVLAGDDPGRHGPGRADGTLDLSGEETVHFASGTVVNNAAGTGAGTINDTGDDSTLYFDNTQTFNNATINLGNVRLLRAL